MGNLCCVGDDEEYDQMHDGYQPPTHLEPTELPTIEVRPQMRNFIPKDTVELTGEEFQKRWKDFTQFEVVSYGTPEKFSRSDFVDTLIFAQIFILAKSSEDDPIFKL